MHIWRPKYAHMEAKVCIYGYQSMHIWRPKCAHMEAKMCTYSVFLSSAALCLATGMQEKTSTIPPTQIKLFFVSK